MSRIAGVFVGTPQTYVAEDGTSWRSAIYKSLVEGPVALGPRSLDGDKVADTKNHGDV